MGGSMKKQDEKQAQNVLDLEIVVKARLLRIFLITMLIILPIVSITDLIAGDYASVIAEGALIIAVLASVLLLRTGKYKVASRIATVIFYIGAIFLALITPSGAGEPVSVFKLVTYMGAALAFASFFLIDPKVPPLLAPINALGAVVFVFVRFSGKFPTGLLVNEALVAMIFSSIISVLIIAPTRMSRGISNKLEAKQRLDEERTTQLEAVAHGSENNLGAIGTLTGKVADIRAAAEAALEAVARIETRVRELDGDADAATSEAHSIGNRVSDLNRHIETEATTQEESTASVNQMVTSVGSVAESARKRRAGLQGLRGTAEEGERRLGQLLLAIKRMDESVGSIRDMIGVINKIASSTNLLAMNAAIEAAHAGDAGKGFAVVADEIRNLAEGSGKNAKEIAVKLKEIVSAISEAAGEGERTGKSFSLVILEIGQAISSFDEIAAAMQELTESGKQILDTVRALNEASQGLREGGSAIAVAQGNLIALQGRTKVSVSAVQSDANEVASRARSLISVAAEVSLVAEEGERAASALHESMARIKSAEIQEI